MNLKPDLFARYLKILRSPLENPSLEYLQRLVQAQLHFVPYENISKILRLKFHGPSIPSLEEFIILNEEFGFGGTCFVQNGYFAELLKWLGFDAEIIGVGFSPENVRHPCIRIHLGENTYLIDLGNFSSFAGPFSMQPGTVVVGHYGDWTYKYHALEKFTHKVESFRNGKPGRVWRSHPPVRRLLFFESAIDDTFLKDSMFMTKIAAHRLIDGDPVFQWGTAFGMLQGESQTKKKIASIEELEKVFAVDLKLPRYPVRKAAEILKEWNGTDLFEEVKSDGSVG